ncbi:MAG TPA: ERF family protein [Gammaproteobacteria bacterium]|nr:ERF family protein [Gammaproteobacteria bacterium]
MTAQSKPNLYQRILSVERDVPYIQKDATVEAGAGRSYKGVTHDAVIAKLRKSMIEHGIVLAVRQTSERAIDGQTMKGHPKIRYEAWYEITLYNADSPDEYLTYPVHAHAEDGGDKAPGKAMSYATKTVLLKAFALETGESDESRYQPEELAYLTAEQAGDLRQLMDDTDTEEASFCGWLKVDSIELLPASRYESARKALLKKAEKLGNTEAA